MLEEHYGSNRAELFVLCARSGFTSQVKQAAAERDDLLLLAPPCVVAG